MEGIATESSAIEGSGVSLDSVLPENGERVANLEERMEKEEQQIIFGEEDEMDDGYDEDDYDEDGEAVSDVSSALLAAISSSSLFASRMSDRSTMTK